MIYVDSLSFLLPLLPPTAGGGPRAENNVPAKTNVIFTQEIRAREGGSGDVAVGDLCLFL